MLYFSYKSQPINMSVYAHINMCYMGLVEATEWVWLRALLKWHSMRAVTVNRCHMTRIYGDGEKPYLHPMSCIQHTSPMYFTSAQTSNQTFILLTCNCLWYFPQIHPIQVVWYNHIKMMTPSQDSFAVFTQDGNKCPILHHGELSTEISCNFMTGCQNYVCHLQQVDNQIHNCAKGIHLERLGLCSLWQTLFEEQSSQSLVKPRSCMSDFAILLSLYFFCSHTHPCSQPIVLIILTRPRHDHYYEQHKYSL